MKKKQKMTEEMRDAIISTPGSFAQYVSRGRWKSAKHLNLLQEILIKTANRKLTKVIVNMPPRHGKSEMISKYFPAWYLCQHPDHRIILTSYESRFAISWGKKVRNILSEYGNELFDIKINPKSNTAQYFELLSTGGSLSCIGAGGAITGKGADILIIDDPVKNSLEANSPVIREKVWDWFQSTALTRLEPNGAVIIVMTRWHEDDICGRIISANSLVDSNISDLLPDCDDEVEKSWSILRLPAIAEDNDLIGRLPGEPLWNFRFSTKKLDEIKKGIGDYWFSSLYQQSPAPLGKGIFRRKNFRFFKSDGEFYHLDVSDKVFQKARCSVYATVDLAASTKETADFTVIIIFAVTPDREILVLDVIRDRFDAANHVELLKTVFFRYQPLLIGVESVQYQLSLIRNALREGLPIKELKPRGDKLSRALPIANHIDSGMVYFPAHASWYLEFEKELLAFPLAAHDDQVDAFAYITDMIQPVANSMPAGTALKRKLKGIARNF